jgi:hypothetical protein
MSLAHNVCRACAAVVAAGLLSGCQFTGPTPPAEKLNSTPLVVDEAMQLRDWEPVSATYQSGATVAGPTLFFVEPDPTLPMGEDFITENVLFVGQVALMPVTAVFQPPWSDVTYRGVRMEPSYTASPPLETDYENMAREAHEGYR